MTARRGQRCGGALFLVRMALVEGGEDEQELSIVRVDESNGEFSSGTEPLEPASEDTPSYAVVGDVYVTDDVAFPYGSEYLALEKGGSLFIVQPEPPNRSVPPVLPSEQAWESSSNQLGNDAFRTNVRNECRMLTTSSWIPLRSLIIRGRADLPIAASACRNYFNGAMGRNMAYGFRLSLTAGAVSPWLSKARVLVVFAAVSCSLAVAAWLVYRQLSSTPRRFAEMRADQTDSIIADYTEPALPDERDSLSARAGEPGVPPNATFDDLRLLGAWRRAAGSGRDNRVR
ncbi:hypothetical protein HPB52_007671 [Rhipicephalus sanguineus]|uniref:Uncharacterized protein n=1 Tax=Rhipicephalus sanguineus TaxID=34632 RepID=A0A9D4PZR4_RHISA|nr:hypothetical protein HPB52_007671 [Rhipicephalus sanguineus]